MKYGMCTAAGSPIARDPGAVERVDPRERRSPAPPSTCRSLRQAHAVRVVRDGARPVREDAEDADLPSQHVQDGQDVTVVLQSIERGLIVELRAGRTLPRQHLL